MPTKNARMMLTLKPATLKNVQAMATAIGIPAATYVAQLLDEMGPMLSGMATAAMAAKEKRVEAFDHLTEQLNGLQVDAAQVQLALTKGRRAAQKKPKARRVASR